MWSIGIYSGSSPFNLRPAVANPVLAAAQINDLKAAFIADPFMLPMASGWCLFFEILPDAGRASAADPHAGAKGVIGMATSDDGFDWRYQGVVLEEPWHLSYPHVFNWRGRHYMVPETLGANAVRLYQATAFPQRWQLCAELLEGQHADATPFYYQQRWWMFTCPRPQQHDCLALYHADALSGPWRLHPRSPIIADDVSRARPAGRVLHWQGRLFRFAQDCRPRYGSAVRVFEITRLSTTEYLEHEHADSPILQPSGNGWNGRNMHHIDVQPDAGGGWLACVDGYRMTA
ncbi:MAG: hypothetical protein Tsb002_06450 [Wenzhouxiangellaceae bacterium]